MRSTHPLSPLRLVNELEERVWQWKCLLVEMMCGGKDVREFGPNFTMAEYAEYAERATKVQTQIRRLKLVEC